MTTAISCDSVEIGNNLNARTIRDEIPDCTPSECTRTRPVDPQIDSNPLVRTSAGVSTSPKLCDGTAVEIVSQALAIVFDRTRYGDLPLPPKPSLAITSVNQGQVVRHGDPV